MIPSIRQVFKRVSRSFDNCIRPLSGGRSHQAATLLIQLGAVAGNRLCLQESLRFSMIFRFKTLGFHSFFAFRLSLSTYVHTYVCRSNRCGFGHFCIGFQWLGGLPEWQWKRPPTCHRPTQRIPHSGSNLEVGRFRVASSGQKLLENGGELTMENEDSYNQEKWWIYRILWGKLKRSPIGVNCLAVSPWGWCSLHPHVGHWMLCYRVYIPHYMLAQEQCTGASR